ncbi:MAG: hypothetical protein J6Y56_07075 [Fibrobacterales bacterium]|nr:hypothetical protein [Fibrobacterales bacterium]
MVSEIQLEKEAKPLSAMELTEAIGDRDIRIKGFETHSKASESYVLLAIRGKEWQVPYFYRRTNLFIDSTQKLVDYIKERKPFLNAKSVKKFQSRMQKGIEELFGAKSTVTLPGFKKLLAKCGNWVLNTELFPPPNPQRRIQDLKEKGFTISTKSEGKKTYHMLLPFDIVKAPTYETFSSKTRKSIFAALDGMDAYNNKSAGRSVLPDHKFPEIRWDKDTPVSNEELTEDEMRQKFQLVPEAINQQKREVCRKCFQMGHRGTFFGIDFFYSGDGDWPANVAKNGKEAESGCVGCFWYDMAAWRTALNDLIKKRKK